MLWQVTQRYVPYYILPKLSSNQYHCFMKNLLNSKKWTQIRRSLFIRIKSTVSNRMFILQMSLQEITCHEFRGLYVVSICFLSRLPPIRLHLSIEVFQLEYVHSPEYLYPQVTHDKYPEPPAQDYYRNWQQRSDDVADLKKMMKRINEIREKLRWKSNDSPVAMFPPIKNIKSKPKTIVVRM